MKNKILIISTKLTLRLHNFAYRLSTKFAVKAEGGLHPKHRIMNYHKFFIENIKEGENVLDMGCGNGALAFDLAKRAKKVVAIDMSEQNIRVAQENYSAKNIEYLFGDAIEYSFNEIFDVVILSNVLEHIANRGKFLKKVKNLSPKILIRVPMINRDWITLYKKENGIEWRLDKTHFTEYTLGSFKNELKTVDLKLEKYSIQFGEIWAMVR
jgi:2-polyprenyl-3-methyl-5-hydroxy-6-metoxy-1,4-benzoquinol methylase